MSSIPSLAHIFTKISKSLLRIRLEFQTGIKLFVYRYFNVLRNYVYIIFRLDKTTLNISNANTSIFCIGLCVEVSGGAIPWYGLCYSSDFISMPYRNPTSALKFP